MNGINPLSYLKKVCTDERSEGHGERLKRALLQVVVPASAGFAIACYAATPPEGGEWIYDPRPEVCTNQLDDDYDGDVDCDDQECRGLEICLGCGDGIDNDDNGTTDCFDLSCSLSEPCAVGGAGCEDVEDNDGDGLVDCMDPDCAGSEECP